MRQADKGCAGHRKRGWRISIACWLLLSVAVAHAQNGGGGGGGGNNGGGNNGGGNQQVGGILISPAGVLGAITPAAESAGLRQKRAAAFAEEHLSTGIANSVPCRKVSLVRLCAALQATRPTDSEAPVPTAEMAALAGLTQIDFVFVDAERQDVVLAGPAGLFAPHASGRLVSVETGRAVLLLEDLLVAVRNSEGERVGCSIDPRPEGLANLQRFLASNTVAASTAAVRARYQRMAEVLGPQDISITGVPTDSRFAVNLVEADYHMKMLSLGLEASGIRALPSHLQMAQPNGNSLQRFWFTPLYESLHEVPDHSALALTGQRWQLLSQDELVGWNGERSAAATTRFSTHQWASRFTENFPGLAKNYPSFSQLQNQLDLVVAATWLREHPLWTQWVETLATLTDAQILPVPTYATPQTVPTQVNTRMANSGTMLGLLAGGVQLSAQRVLNRTRSSAPDELRLPGTRDQHLQSQPAAPETWWWD